MKCRLIAAGDQLSANTPHGNRCPLLLERFDQMLIQIVAGKDLRIGQSGGIENFSCFDTQIRQITAVEADANHAVARSS